MAGGVAKGWHQKKIQFFFSIFFFKFNNFALWRRNLMVSARRGVLTAALKIFFKFFFNFFFLFFLI